MVTTTNLLSPQRVLNPPVESLVMSTFMFMSIPEFISPENDLISSYPGSDTPESPAYQPYLSLAGTQAQLSFLLGEVLTIIDASISDHTQRKALKDVLKSRFHDRSNYLQRLRYGECAVSGNVSASKVPTNQA